MSARLCEVVTRWGAGNTIAEQCGRPAIYRYATMGGGWMHLCAEHGAKHASYSERLVDGEWVETPELHALKEIKVAPRKPDRAFGAALSEWMAGKGYTAAALAKLTGYSASTIGQWRYGWNVSRRARAVLRDAGFNPEVAP